MIQIGIASSGAAAGTSGGWPTPACTPVTSASIDSRMFRVPVFSQIAMIPSAKPTSPTRFVMNAFLLASAALRLRYQNPISR
jgi:hypothetical protein